MDKTKLFDDFEAVNAEKWKEKMLLDLKGLPYDKLIWKTNEGISVKPFYTAEDLENLSYLKTGPGEFPYLRGNQNASNNWEIRQDIVVDNVATSNSTALHALNWGATSIGFIIKEDMVLSSADIKSLLNDIYIDCININFLNHSQSAHIFELLAAEVKSRKIETSKITGSVDNDPLGFLTRYGKFSYSEEEDFKISASLINNSSSLFPGLRTLGINAHIFHNAGANIVQELGFSLAIISDYLDLLSKAGAKPEAIAKSMQLNFSVGPVYFMEIAKIRAIRLLFARLVQSWGIQDENSLKTFVHCSTSEWNQTVYDPYVNMLRATTESMSAAMGGCDSLTVRPFDKPYRKTTAFSERIARNTQIILKEEAWLDKVQDPAAGAFFIENITDSIIEESWKLFLEIEDLGGYLAAFKAGEIQKRIDTSASQKNQNVSSRKEILLGTNQYPNLLENKPEDLDTSVAFPLNKKQSGLVAEPLTNYRGSMAFEKLRLKVESNPKKVFLLTIGNPVWRKARAGFSASFFGCAGFEIIDNPGFESLETGIKQALKEKSSIVVLCSSDEEYANYAPVALISLDKKAVLVVAGFPKDSIEELKSKGVQNFIHMKSNVLDELEKYYKLISE